MSFDPGWLVLSLVASTVGLALFLYGKKNDRWPHLVAGFLLMVYPYFTTGVASLVIVALLLGAALWYLIRTGR
jgi:4-hydroxybenzoate polyprenyltransferase